MTEVTSRIAKIGNFNMVGLLLYLLQLAQTGDVIQEKISIISIS